MSKAQRIVLVVLAGVVIVGSLVLFTPEDEDESPPPAKQATSEAATGGKTATAKPKPPKATTIEVRGGEPLGGVKPVSAKKGETVRLVVTADAPSEIHVHGYDLLKSAAPGRPARFTFKAGIEGVFEVELEGPHTLVAKLEVRPG